MRVGKMYNDRMKTLIFGGAFDPPHKEHVAMCNAAMQQLGADRLVLVPTYLPRHKSEGLLDFDVRAELAYAAFGGRAEVDRIERERGGDNFSYLVLPLLKQKYGDIIYLIGGDSLEFMPTCAIPKRSWRCVRSPLRRGRAMRT